MISTQATCVRLGRASWGLRLIGRARNPRAWGVMEIKILWPITKGLTNTFFILFRRSFFLKMQMKTIALENVLSKCMIHLRTTIEEDWKCRLNHNSGSQGAVGVDSTWGNTTFNFFLMHQKRPFQFESTCRLKKWLWWYLCLQCKCWLEAQLESGW